MDIWTKRLHAQTPQHIAEPDAVVGGDRMEQAAQLSLVTASVAITIFKKTLLETPVYSFLDKQEANSYCK